MIRFVDGPAAGQVLELQRVPLLLRVVRDCHTGQWDALDQLDDKPKPSEVIHLYLRSGTPQRIQVKADRKAGGCRWLWHGEYMHLPDQPIIDVLRDNAAWQAWAAKYCAPREVN
jgi:hypothetical protein